jgi:hypothetical protein
MNALKHGERTAERIASRSEMWASLQLLRAERMADDGPAAAINSDLAAVWVDRIADELAGQ